MSKIRIQEQPLNRIKVAPVIAKGGEPDPDKIKGYDFIPLLYANIFLCAKKKSGKTNVIYNLLENLVTAKSTVYIFCSTVHKDSTYAAIMKMLKKKNISFEAHTHFIEKDGKKNILKDILIDEEDVDGEKEIVYERKPGAKERKLTVGHQGLLNRYAEVFQNGQKVTDYTRVGRDFAIRPFDPRIDISYREFKPKFGPAKVNLKKGVLFAPMEAADFDDRIEYAKPQRKSGTEVLGPESIFVFDDLGSDLRHPSINQLLKTNRHEKSKVILSSQYITDLQPQAIKQIDFCMLFKAFGEDKLKKIHELFDLSIEFQPFLDLYRFATAAPFSFLYIDVRTESFRKNFNAKLSVEQEGKREKRKTEEETDSESKSSKRTKHGKDEEPTNDGDDDGDGERA